jgi:hypothetical protein
MMRVSQVKLIHLRFEATNPFGNNWVCGYFYIEIRFSDPDGLFELFHSNSIRMHFTIEIGHNRERARPLPIKFPPITN